jgi:hypothetical protein
MNCSQPSPSVRAFGAWMIAIILGSCMAAGGQVPATTTTTTTPQTRAQAAAQARANAAQARENAAQARAAERAAKLQQKQQTASTTAKTATSPALKTPTTANTATSPASTTPATANGSSALGRTTQTPGAQTPASSGSGTVGTGTLAWGTRVYTSTGCVHNGNSAVCTFTFVNQGNEATLAAGAELAGIQFVDDAHVPHHWSGAHFMDKYGEQQARLIVQPGDTGTYVVVFPNVNPKVASAEFHLREQIVGGITVGATGGNTGTSALSTAKTAPAAPQ